MKTKLIILGIIVSIFTFCEESKTEKESVDSITKQRQDQSTFDAILNQTGGNAIESYAFVLNSAELVDSALNISVSYSGGCAKHGFELVWPETITMIYPPQFDLILIHDNNDDGCEAYPTETLVFDLSNNPLGMKLSDFYLMHLGIVNASNPEERVMLNDNYWLAECADALCTKELRTIALSILDQNGNPIALDSFKVTNVENDKDMTQEFTKSDFEWMQLNGSYPIFGDQYANEYRNLKLDLNFKGYIGDREVVNENYTVSADCCHVFKIAGNTDLVIAE